MDASADDARPPGRGGSPAADAADDDASGARSRPSAWSGYPELGRRAWAAGLVSVAVHALVIALVAFPGPEPRAAAARSEPFRHVQLPPRVEVPPGPDPVPRPPAPEARRVEVEEPLRSAGTPVPAPPPGPAPRPPDVAAVAPDDRPALAEADIPPVMEAPEELRDRLRRRYPDRLRDLERGGVVELQFFVGTGGDVERVEVSESSGHRRLDRTARRITAEVTFLPAMIRDRPVGLWVRQRICFVFVDDPDDPPSPEECERRVKVSAD